MGVFGCASSKDRVTCLPKQQIEPDPDIAGIGVIVGFLTTSLLAFLVALFVLFLQRFRRIATFFRSAFTDDKRPYQPPDGQPHWRSSDFWSEVLAKNLLSLADTQIVTGLAVQFTALLQHCDLTFYHFRVVNNLALLTTVTHLLTVVVLRDYFVEYKWINLPRVITMLGNLGFLGYTSYITDTYYKHADGLDESNKLACYFWMRRPSFGAVFSGRVALLICAIGSHFAIILAMYVLQNDGDKRNPVDEERKKTTWFQLKRFGAITRTWIIMPAYAIYGVYRASRALKRTQVFGDRDLLIEPGGETKWGFGQFLPVLLLALPIYAGWESFWELKDSWAKARGYRYGLSTRSLQAGNSSVFDGPNTQRGSNQQHSRDPSTEEKRVGSSSRHRSASRSPRSPRDHSRAWSTSGVSISPLPTPAFPSPLQTPPIPTPSPHLSVPSPANSPHIGSRGRGSPTLRGSNSPS